MNGEASLLIRVIMKNNRMRVSQNNNSKTPSLYSSLALLTILLVAWTIMSNEKYNRLYGNKGKWKL